MDPHELVEKILTGQIPQPKDVDIAFDITEILDEVAAVDQALEELEQAVTSFETNANFDEDRIDINRRLQEDEYLANMENQFHI